MSLTPLITTSLSSSTTSWAASPEKQRRIHVRRLLPIHFESITALPSNKRAFFMNEFTNEQNSCRDISAGSCDTNTKHTLSLHLGCFDDKCILPFVISAGDVGTLGRFDGL